MSALTQQRPTSPRHAVAVHARRWACAFLLFSNCAFAQDAGGSSDPSRIVTKLHDTLIEVMRNSEQLGYPGRYGELQPVIVAHFDTPLIVKVILSSYWNELSEDQKHGFIELFNRLSIATYASRFNDYDGEQFVETAREELKKARLLIRTEMQRPNDVPVKLDYLMHQKEDGRWYIISVIANGVNDLSLKRAEYAAVIEERGYEGLVQNIERKIADMENEAKN